jgi:predicted AAA+ superfamily ATPase
MIARSRETRTLRGLLERYPVVAIVGARQVGKTTLAKATAAGHNAVAFDLEDPTQLARLGDPVLALSGLRGLVVIDEVQRHPDLFPVLRVLADREGRPATFLVLGSASPGLLRQSSESLAGRIAYHELGGFALDEVGVESRDELWLRGGFPRAYLAASDAHSAEWRRAFVQTFLERDMPQLGFRLPAPTLHRFWSMLAHCHGQVWASAELARSFGVADTTVRRYLDALAGSMVVRTLQPWHENLAKRQVKSPKVYVADTGLLHTLLGIRAREDLDVHPKLGASWEGFVIDQVVRRLGAHREECWFWATHSGAELDLLITRGRRRLGFEVKRTSAPRITPSMRSAAEDLKLDSLDVIHAGSETFPMSNGIRAVAACRLLDDLDPLE